MPVRLLIESDDHCAGYSFFFFFNKCLKTHINVLGVTQCIYCTVAHVLSTLQLK